MDILDDLDTAVGAATKLLDLVKGVRGFFPTDKKKELAAAEEAILLLKDQCVTSKEAILALRKENADIKDEIFCMEQRLKDMEQGTLRQIADGVFAYVLDDTSDVVKTGPWYCQACFDQGKKAVFQRVERSTGADHYQCPCCRSQIHVPNGRMVVGRGTRERRRSEVDGYSL